MSLSSFQGVLGRSPTATSLQIGNVDGPTPGVSTDNAVVRWDGTTGRLIQNSVLIVADTTGALSGFTTGAGITFHGGGTLTGASGALTLTGNSADITLAPNATVLIPGTKTLKFGATANATFGVSADTTAGNVVITAPSTGSVSLVSGAASSLSSTITSTTTDSGTRIWNTVSGTGSADGLGLELASTTASIWNYENGALRFATNNAVTLTLSATTGQITGGAANMILTAGTGNSRTMALQTTTSGGTATTFMSTDDVQNTAFAGSVRAGNFATASAPPYAKGVIYFDTTLNKLRVGGAAAFETITSA